MGLFKYINFYIPHCAYFYGTTLWKKKGTKDSALPYLNQIEEEHGVMTSVILTMNSLDLPTFAAAFLINKGILDPIKDS